MVKNKWFAAHKLIFTKQTRLKMNPELFDDIRNWPKQRILDELEYMSNTIASSWEFIDYTFLINDCTRAFTHQLVRSRNNSYAQQTMRILDVSGFEYKVGPSIESDVELLEMYCCHMENTDNTYKELIKKGAAIEDARGVLPTNIHTNIVVKINLRSAADVISKRSSIRTQDEYREFVELMRKYILDVHPWAGVFL